MSDRKQTAIVDELLRSFTGKMCRLCGHLADKFPYDADAQRLRSRIRLLADTKPTELINAVGPYLYTFRVQILSHDANFFLQKDYGEELNNAGAAGDAGVTKLIEMVKIAFASSSPEVKLEYADTMVELLSIYADFLSVIHNIG